MEISVRLQRSHPLSPCNDHNNPFAAEKQNEESSGCGRDEAWDKGGVIPKLLGPGRRLEASLETRDGVSSQTTLVWTGKKVSGAAGGRLRAPAWAAEAAGSMGLAEGHLLEQGATAPSEGAAGYQPLVCLCTGLHTSMFHKQIVIFLISLFA